MIVVVLVLAAPSAKTQEKQVLVRAKNLSGSDRSGEIVTVPWKDIRARVFSFDPTRLSVREGTSKSALVAQVVRRAGEDAPDYLVFRADFKAGEAKEFHVVQSSEKHEFKSLTDARFVPPREDLAWENDRIAFRMYGPPQAKEGYNNGIDVWNKRVRSLIFEHWYEGEGRKPTILYHEDQGEGGNYFTVGNSLGAGACALVKGDSLYQPGVFQKYKIIATGPLQAIFELTYNPVLYEGTMITEVMRITLSAGVNLNKIDVTFSGGSGKVTALFAAGIVKRMGTTTSFDRQNGFVSLWGLTTDKEEVGYLGTGIVMPATTIQEMKEDTVHAMIIGKVELGKSSTYYAGAGWTLSTDFSSGADWNKYLSEFAQKIQSPLSVSVSAK